MALVTRLDSTSADPTVGGVLFSRRCMAQVSVTVEERRPHPLGFGYGELQPIFLSAVAAQKKGGDQSGAMRRD